jgi:alkaline phosphatase
MAKARRLPVALGGLGAVVLLGIAASFAIGGQQTRTDQVRSALHGGKARNVIFFLGDGMGTQEITAARYYQVGAAGRLNVDRLPFTGFQTTWSVKPAAAPPYLPDYDPDSAATGTMWATGSKTIDERVSQGPSAAIDVPGENLKTVLEVAQRQGKATGNVSTAEITDATPAVLDSHISLRGCQGPADAATSCKKETKDAGGLGSIAEQTVDHHVDVVLGGGRNRFTQTITGGPDAGKTVVDSAQRQGYQYVTDAAGLDAVQSVKRKPLLGLFAPVNMTTEWTGPIATLGDGTPAQKCVTTNRPANEPSLAAMTKKAISLLQNDKDGFFLQVEGASIDKQDHAANACGQIGETVAFDDAIGVALEYQRWHPDTLIVVTADHAHTSQIVGEDTTGSGNPTGYSSNLITKDGQTLRITYGTAGGNPAAAAPPSQQHTGSVVPIWGIGPGAAAILGTTDHTDLFGVLQGDDGHRH